MPLTNKGMENVSKSMTRWSSNFLIAISKQKRLFSKPFENFNCQSNPFKAHVYATVNCVKHSPDSLLARCKNKYGYLLHISHRKKLKKNQTERRISNQPFFHSKFYHVTWKIKSVYSWRFWTRQKKERFRRISSFEAMPRHTNFYLFLRFDDLRVSNQE